MSILKSKPYIAVEFIILCIAFPTAIWMTNSGNAMFGFLWAAFLYTGFVWWRINNDTSSPRHEQPTAANSHCGDPENRPPHGGGGNSLLKRIKTEWNWGAVTWDNMRQMLIRWVIATILICAFTAWHSPDRLFYIPMHAPEIIPFLFLAYPLLSALPQEFIFCTFFMKRYGGFLKSKWAKIIISAAVFGYAHMLFINWIAPVFSFFGGLIFAHTYLKTRSLALVTIEHSLYGNSIFMAGIGYYFYSGGIGQ